MSRGAAFSSGVSGVEGRKGRVSGSMIVRGTSGCCEVIIYGCETSLLMEQSGLVVIDEFDVTQAEVDDRDCILGRKNF